MPPKRTRSEEQDRSPEGQKRTKTESAAERIGRENLIEAAERENRAAIAQLQSVEEMLRMEDQVTQNPNVQFNGQDPDSVTVEWKKIYIDMTTIVSGSPTADFFRNSFEAILPSGKTQAIINIDNIKVVHF